MAEETSLDAQTNQGISFSKLIEEENDDLATKTDVHNTGMEIKRAKEAYRPYTMLEEEPSKGEVWVWYLYGLCSYFIHTALIPIVFPLIISQVSVSPAPDHQGLTKSYKGLACTEKEMNLYEGLTNRTININSSIIFSPLEWTSFSWAIGLILAAPLFGYIATHLDHGQNQKLIAAAATAIGAIFCLPTGFFQTTKIFPLYIAAIVIAEAIATASHTRHLGLMVRGFTGPNIRKSEFPKRRGISSWFSLYATAASCLGAAIISAFTYRMLRQEERFISLWVVSIYSGIIWLAGIVHILTIRPGATTTSHIPRFHFLSIFNYPHAIGSLIGIFLSSFTAMCIFTGGVLHLVGHLCLKPEFLLYFWLIYFMFPSFSLPLMQPLQHVFKANAVKMKLFGFFLSLVTSGFGFYFKDKNWFKQHVLVFSAIQSTSAGLLHAFGRVLLLDCSPPGKEGAFSLWFSWMRALGTCAGFAVASAMPGNVSYSFGIAFWTAISGALVLLFGNVSDYGGALSAGIVIEDSEDGTPQQGLDTGVKGHDDLEETP